MVQRKSPTFYLHLLEFLMTAKQHIVAVGNEFGLTGIQAITLMLIDADAPRPMKSFCVLYHCDASNVTGIVDGLENKGLISRQNDPNDRRVKVIQLEAAGKRLQQTILKRLIADSSYLFDPLNPSETDQFVRIVEKLAVHTETAKTIAK